MASFEVGDPYQLERLAEELASREKQAPLSPSVDKTAQLQLAALPDYSPLSHDNPLLTGPVFNAEEFLLSRAGSSLPELRTELRDYLSTLKEELIQLINNDYEAFISLSTDLRSEGSRLKKMRGPLGDLRSRVLESRKELRTIQDAIQEKLDKRATLREEKALLHLLLKISESVTRLESLLLITSPDQDGDFVGVTSSGVPTAHDDTYEEKGRSNRAKHIARVAAEYTQLLYHVSKAREERCAFVDEVQWRIDRIHSTLSSDLDHLFAALLTKMRDSKPDGRLSEIERAKLLNDLKECLRTYDLLGLWRDAEDVLRREVVRPFLRKTIYHNSLGAPHSPVVPKTPFHSKDTELIPSTGFPLRTPYSPFTAFPFKQGSSPSHTSTHLAAPLHIVLPEDSDNPLAYIYNQVLRFVARDVKDIMELAEKVSKKKATKDKALGNDAMNQETDLEEFQIMAHVVWEEVANAIINDIGDIVFAAGRPDDLRKNYDTTQNFLRCLELYAPSATAVHAMRSHQLYHEFERRWQLPVYFQLRWKEIVVDIEGALNELRVEPSTPRDKSAFALPQTAAVWKAITMCWSPEILIPELSHRFWRLTLQLLSRHAAWFHSVYATIGEGTSGMRSTTSTNAAIEPSSTETVAVDEVLLRQYAAIVGDIRLLENKVDNLWRQEISIILPPNILENSDGPEPQDVLKYVLSKSASVTQTASSQIISILTKRCCEALLPVRSIPSQFRAMPNKRLPTEPSYFVQTIFRPLKAFFGIGGPDGPGRALEGAFLQEYSQEVFCNVVQRYISFLAAMKKTEESLRKLKKGKKTTFSLFGNVKDDDGRDEERIRTQMILDVEAFGKEAQSLGINLAKNEHYEALKSVVLTEQDDG